MTQRTATPRQTDTARPGSAAAALTIVLVVLLILDVVVPDYDVSPGTLLPLLGAILALLGLEASAFWKGAGHTMFIQVRALSHRPC